jgi:hypothetical protein
MKRLLIVLLFAAPLVAHAKEILPFIDDDYSKAIARARTENIPLFADAWAPW